MTAVSSVDRETPRVERVAVPRLSPTLLRLFRFFARRYLAKHLHALRVSRTGPLPSLPEGTAVIVVVNHPSWWDPLVAVVMWDRFPGRRHFAPMDAAALARYRFFGRLGFFGIEPDSVAGATTLLRTGRAILTQPDTMMWITAQGKFTDPRLRPPGLKPGVGLLVRSLERVVVFPLALEYPFWQERTAEALIRFGEPLVVGDGRERSAREWTAIIETRLEAAQDALAAEAVARDEALFDVVIRGKAGVGGVYDWWRRLKAWAGGQRFEAEHGTVRRR
jgi:1-acyl-sn-glycerol-3-phosphate acyltransferase